MYPLPQPDAARAPGWPGRGPVRGPGRAPGLEIFADYILRGVCLGIGIIQK